MRVDFEGWEVDLDEFEGKLRVSIARVDEAPVRGWGWSHNHAHNRARTFVDVDPDRHPDGRHKLPR